MTKFNEEEYRRQESVDRSNDKGQNPNDKSMPKSKDQNSKRRIQNTVDSKTGESIAKADSLAETRSTRRAKSFWL